MPIIAKCSVCHVEDELQNLAKLAKPEGAYAHKHFIERYNKDVEKKLRALDASMTAHEVRDHDINPDDDYAVESFLRRQDKKVSRQFIGEVANAAREQRDRDNMAALFETTEQKVEAWPAEIDDDFIAEVAADLADIISRLAGGDWRSDGAIETKAARYAAALLLIKQVAWRKFNAERNASYEEWAASEESA